MWGSLECEHCTHWPNSSASFWSQVQSFQLCLWSAAPLPFLEVNPTICAPTSTPRPLSGLLCPAPFTSTHFYQRIFLKVNICSIPFYFKINITVLYHQIPWMTFPYLLLLLPYFQSSFYLPQIHISTLLFIPTNLYRPVVPFL